MGVAFVRIMLVHNNYTTHGGAEVFVHEIARILVENGHEVAFFCVGDEKNNSSWSKYWPSAVDYKKGSLISSALQIGKLIYNTDAKMKISTLIDLFKPDIIHCFAIYSRLTPSILDACKKKNIPTIMSCNDYKHICPNYKLYHHGQVCEDCENGNYFNAIKNKCAHNSLPYSVAVVFEAYIHHQLLNIYRKNIHTFLFSSEFMAHKTEKFWGKDSFRWRKLKNPFNSTKYQATCNPGGPVLFFGRIIDEKGVDILVHAASKLPDITFRIIGDGPDLESLKKLTEELKLDNVTFTGAKWGDAMDDELKQCSFVVVPSIWHENFPYVINQAFAFGKPVIGSNRGGITELVAHGERGLVYEATSPGALAGAVHELWSNPARIETMGKRAKEFSDREFNDENIYQTLCRIYEEVLS